jgi:hypothetical protein
MKKKFVKISIVSLLLTVIFVSIIFMGSSLEDYYDYYDPYDY